MANKFQDLIEKKMARMKMKLPGDTIKKDTVSKYYTEEETIKRIYKVIIKNSNIPPKFTEASFANFNLSEINPRNKSKVESLKNYARNINQAVQIPQSIYMFSEYNGCGKTHLAVAILKQAAWQYAANLYHQSPLRYKRRGIDISNLELLPIFFMSEKNYLYKKKLLFSNEDKKLQEEVRKIERMVIRSDLLVIDDFLKERNTDFTFNELTSWICLRYEQNKPVIFTSNMDFTDLALCNKNNPYYKTDNFNNATYLASRISEMTKGYKFYFYSSPGDDFRQKSY